MLYPNHNHTDEFEDWLKACPHSYTWVNTLYDGEVFTEVFEFKRKDIQNAKETKEEDTCQSAHDKSQC